MGIKPSTQLCQGVFTVEVSEGSEIEKSDFISDAGQEGSNYLLQEEWLSDVCGVPRRR